MSAQLSASFPGRHLVVQAGASMLLWSMRWMCPFWLLSGDRLWSLGVNGGTDLSVLKSLLATRMEDWFCKTLPNWDEYAIRTGHVRIL